MASRPETQASASDNSRIIGYTAVEGCPAGPENLAASEKAFLLELARWSVKMSADGHELPEATNGNVPPRLAANAACFVTLTNDGRLRGCVGQLEAREPLYRAVINNARNAATRDCRFPAVEAWEVDDIRIEISVLSDIEPLRFDSPEKLLAKLHPNEHGVVLRIGPRAATFLPQVWAHLTEKVDFLNYLSRKAGCEPFAWRGPDVSVSVYRVESFTEPD